ncbi:Ankyrin repeat-containing protein [Nymphaea thermarum]|nr:Ankyrin repeat-containing protein [Nymphaea thermarum]
MGHFSLQSSSPVLFDGTDSPATSGSLLLRLAPPVDSVNRGNSVSEFPSKLDWLNSPPLKFSKFLLGNSHSGMTRNWLKEHEQTLLDAISNIVRLEDASDGESVDNPMKTMLSNDFCLLRSRVCGNPHGFHSNAKAIGFIKGLPYSPMDPELYECSLNGDVDFLKQLILRDEHVLERSEKGNNILHVAAIYGHVDFAREALNAKPELSSELNEAGLSPLHLAASKGHLDLVKLFLAADPELSSLKDEHGRLPIHVAAMKGRLDALKEIISVNPWCLKERTDKGETVLHLGVKENRIQVVEFLMGIEAIKTEITRIGGFINEGFSLRTFARRDAGEHVHKRK